VLGDQPRAISYASQALDLFRKLGNQEGVASALDSLGYAEQQGGRFAAATRYFREAADLYREIGSRWGLAEALNHLGDSQHADRNLAEARVAWDEAFAIFDDLGHPDAGPIRGKLRELGARPGN
jgi:tetratricopeptide (TPR) repeat protein